MSLITGEFECKLDAKGRLVLPAKIKSRLPEASGNQVVLMQGMEPCIVLYSVVEYRKTYARLASLNEFNQEYRKLQRNFFRRVAEVELDGAVGQEHPVAGDEAVHAGARAWRRDGTSRRRWSGGDGRPHGGEACRLATRISENLRVVR